MVDLSHLVNHLTPTAQCISLEKIASIKDSVIKPALQIDSVPTDQELRTTIRQLDDRDMVPLW